MTDGIFSNPNRRPENYIDRFNFKSGIFTRNRLIYFPMMPKLFSSRSKQRYNQKYQQSIDQKVYFTDQIRPVSAASWVIWALFLRLSF